MIRIVVFTFVCLIAFVMLAAQPHRHEHGESAEPVNRPRIFLDKSLRIVQYQLKRLDNQRLLLVERKTDDAKYAPVYMAILTRAGLSRQHREEAIHGLSIINKSDAVSELLKALASLDTADRQQIRTGRQLATILLMQPMKLLTGQTESLLAATESESSLLRSVGHAGLITAGAADSAWKRAAADERSTLDWLASIPLVPSAEHRSRQRRAIVGLLEESNPANVRRSAIRALASVPSEQDATFRQIAPFVSDKAYQTVAIRTLLVVPAKARDAATAGMLVDVLVKHAEATPAAERTTDEFIDAMQLADQLLAKIPVAAARSYRQRLREITVRVVRIHTVEEEMRYDTPYFAVEAGRPVQIVLQNEDLMPHNLVVVISEKGALQEVAQQGLVLGPNPGFQGKPYVPKSDKVLFATGMVQSMRQERLTFTAPSQPGEYPYVCTFPRHWMRMYGVMVVVPDLDAWLQKPTKPKDPIGSNRAFVQTWKVDDFVKDLTTGVKGRSAEIGERLFKEATCALCHKVRGQGGSVGPELTDVFKRWKGDRTQVLREILDPSHRIDPKFAVSVIVTVDGKVFTGIVKSEDKTSVSVLVNPEAKEPIVIKRDDIDEMVKTSKSMMPKALLDRFTKDEVFELFAYLISVGVSAK